MNITNEYRIEIKSPRIDSGWIIEVTKKGKYFYLSSREYLLPHELESKLAKLFEDNQKSIKTIFNISISVFMQNEKIEYAEKVEEFFLYMQDLIQLAEIEVG